MKGCGTRAGYERHRRRKEQACEPCLAANRAYAAEYLSRPEQAAMRKVRSAAWAAAKEQLKQRHPEEFREIHQAEMRQRLADYYAIQTP